MRGWGDDIARVGGRDRGRDGAVVPGFALLCAPPTRGVSPFPTFPRCGGGSCCGASWGRLCMSCVCVCRGVHEPVSSLYVCVYICKGEAEGHPPFCHLATCMTHTGTHTYTHRHRHSQPLLRVGDALGDDGHRVGVRHAELALLAQPAAVASSRLS